MGTDIYGLLFNVNNYIIKTAIKIGILLLLFSSMGAGCEKDNEELLHNITLHDKPLPVIQKYITGKWRLQYAFGGLWAHKVINTNNSYMILSPDHITKGNDSGIIVDTTLVWVKTEIGTNDFTYLFSYPPSSISYIVDQIKNDTLVITQYLSDGFTFYYTKY